MAETATLILYKSEITPDKAAKVDNIATYLSSCANTTKSIQYFKHNMSTTLKLDWGQIDTPNFPYNYASITNSDTQKVFYYFITGSVWKSSSCIELSLAMDTVNTFWEDLSDKWRDTTKINRQHKDRFISNGATKFIAGSPKSLYRAVDIVSEGIQPAKYRTTTEPRIHYAMNTTQTKFNYKWYLVYKNKDELTVDEKYPIDCFCCAEADIAIVGATPALRPQDFSAGQTIDIVAQENDDFVYIHGGTTYQIGKNKTYKALEIVVGNGNFTVYIFTQNTKTQVGSGITTAILQNQTVTYHIVSQISDSSNYGSVLLNIANHTISTGSIKNNNLLAFATAVNRADTSIVKIIELPYAPFDLSLSGMSMNIPNGWSVASNGMLKLDNFEQGFLAQLQNADFNTEMILGLTAGQVTANMNHLNHDIKFESKLYHSDFYSRKFFYDTFEKEVLCERMIHSNNSGTYGYRLYFKPSNSLSGNSIFKFAPNSMTYIEPVEYGEYLNCNRNNEVGLYNNEYINYMKTGYNFDVKAKERQLGFGIASAATGLVGGFVSGALGGKGFGTATGVQLGVSAIQSTLSIINQSITAEDAIKQKIQQSKLTASSVSAQNNLDLLDFYNGNKLISFEYDISDYMKNAVYNLLRLSGYACNEIGRPNFNSRYWFNYIECEPELDESHWNYGQEMLNDFKERCRAGIMIYHRHNNEYDFEHDYENFEAWLMNDYN